MKQLIIGDIHGCYDELQDLLDKVGLTSDDQIISIGDMVDRGPKSAECLNFFRVTPNAMSIQGNHERKHVRSYRGQAEAAASQTITRAQIGEDNYADAIAYMDDLPRYLGLPDATLVHAFWEPEVALEDQRENVIVGTMSGEEYLKDNGIWPWYEYYDGDKPLIVGHRDYSDGQMRPFIYEERVYTIDSRCVYGGWLTGLLLPEFKLIEVPSRGDHWNAVMRQYAGIISRYGEKS
ncbi:MAG: metallophosphoesterase [Chloroflexota bacterium]